MWRPAEGWGAGLGLAAGLGLGSGSGLGGGQAGSPLSVEVGEWGVDLTPTPHYPGGRNALPCWG